VSSTVAALNIETWCNMYCLFALFLRFWRVKSMGGMNLKRPTAIEGSMNHAKTSFSTEICAGAVISVVPCLAQLRVASVSRMSFVHACTCTCAPPWHNDRRFSTRIHMRESNILFSSGCRMFCTVFCSSTAYYGVCVL
jgi:hypothetical protein